MNIRKKALQAFRWTIIQAVGARLFSFIVLLVLVRLLEPSEFGLIALAVTAVSFLQIFVAGGFASAIIQRQSVEKGHLDTAFWINVAMSLIAISILWIFSGVIARKFNEPELENILHWISPLLLIQSLNQVQIAILQRKLKFKSLAIRDLIAVPVGGTVGVVMAFSGYGVWSLVGRELVSSITRLMILWYSTAWRPGFSVSYRHFSDLFSFGASMVGSNLAGFFQKRSADLLIGYYLGATSLGYYTIGNRIFRMLTSIISTTLGKIVWPVFSRLQDDMGRLRDAFYYGTNNTSIIVWLVFSGLSVMAPDLVPIVFGNQWLASIPVMQLLAFLGLLRSVYMLNDSVIMAMGKPQWRLYMQIAITITSIFGFFLVVESGIVYVALWYVIAAYLFLPLSLWMVNRLIGISIITYLRGHLGPALGALVMTAVVYILREPLTGYIGQTGRLFLLGALGVLSYVIVVRLVSPAAVAQLSRIMFEMIPARRTIKKTE